MKKSIKIQIKFDNKIAIDTIIDNVDIVEEDNNIKILLKKLNNNKIFENVIISFIYILIQNDNAIDEIIEFTSKDKNIDINILNDNEVLFIFNNGIKTTFKRN